MLDVWVVVVLCGVGYVLKLETAHLGSESSPYCDSRNFTAMELVTQQAEFGRSDQQVS